MKKSNFYLISKSNDLIEKQYRLNLIEQKILLYMISLINPKEDTTINTVTIASQKLWEEIGYEGNVRYEDLVKITGDLRAKPVEFLQVEEDKEKLVQTGWFETAVYNIQDGTIDFKINEALKKYFIDLHNNYTTYRLGMVLSFKSIYSFRIYELLKMIKNIEKDKKSKGHRITEKDYIREISELKKMLCLDEKYGAYKDFKRYILDRVKKEVNELTDIIFEFNPIKTGRKITAVKFEIQEKKQMVLDDIIPTSDNISDEEYNQLASEYGQSVTEKAISELKKVKDKKITNKFKYVKGIAKNISLKNKNNDNDIVGHQYDFGEIERLEKEHIQKELERINKQRTNE